MIKTAVFIETMSIQKYIFASNKLKENIGASHIVKKKFDELRDNYEHSYVGGGNALLYFDSLKEAENAMRDWSRNMLQEAPGLIPIIAIDDNFDLSKYPESRQKIINKAKTIENRFIPQTSLGSFGITSECSRSGLSAEIYAEKLPVDEQQYISSSSYAKIMNEEEDSKELNTGFRNVIGDNYKFTSNMDNLGGAEGENNHIAVIHIDGNDIGDKFKNKETENEVKTFSKGLGEAVENSFKQTLKKLVEKLPNMNQKGEISLKVENNSNKFLPVRPIVIGGDDITFVCDARLGLYLATEFIKHFEKQNICKSNNVTVCAGISIVKTKYPFYRAYKMAEALCSNAKQKRNKENSSDSYIDFHISFGGLGGDLEEIRESDYKSSDGNKLYKRPYSIKQIPKLLDCVSALKKLPQTKVKKLREVLYEGETATKEFIEELGYREKSLPVFSHPDEAEKGFSNGESPYIDIIELADFYPETLLNKEKINA